MSIAISGSIAFDTIMVFEGRFADHILPDQVQMLNVAFLAPTMRQEFGGCAANIAYGLRLLKADVCVLGALGSDGEAYLARLKSLGIDVSAIVQKHDCYTAQAFITTDLADNQITAFHPGAMNHAHESLLSDRSPRLGIVSPNGRDAMLQHAQAFSARGVPFVFDPGQAMPVFSGDELRQLIHSATWLTVNEYEAEMLCRKTGLALSELCESLQPHPLGGVIATLGAQGADIHTRDGACTRVEAMPIGQAIDPTGCGDAFRAGLLYGLSGGMSLQRSVCIATVMGGVKIQSRGGQNHVVSETQVLEMVSKHYPFA